MFSYNCFDKVGYTCIFWAEIACVPFLSPGTLCSDHSPTLPSQPATGDCVWKSKPCLQATFWTLNCVFQIHSACSKLKLKLFYLLNYSIVKRKTMLLGLLKWAKEAATTRAELVEDDQLSKQVSAAPSTCEFYRVLELLAGSPCLPCTLVIRAGAFPFLSYSCTSCHSSLESNYFHAYQQLVIDVKSVSLLGKSMLHVPEPGTQPRLKCKSNEKPSATESFP